MGYKAKNLLGGLFSGIGQGMMAQDKNRRDQAIADRTAAIAALKAGQDDSGMSAGLKRLWDTSYKSHTTVGLNGSDTNFDEMISSFEENPQLSDKDRESLISVTRQRAKPIDEGSDAWLSAADKADAWISDEAGWTSTDKEDFKAYGGNREEARQAKTRQYYFEAGGAGGEASASAAPAAAPASGPDSSGKYSTKEDVKADYLAGKLSRAEASKILKDQFNGTY